VSLVSLFHESTVVAVRVSRLAERLNVGDVIKREWLNTYSIFSRSQTILRSAVHRCAGHYKTFNDFLRNSAAATGEERSLSRHRSSY
jgi:hypothetical protein